MKDLLAASLSLIAVGGIAADTSVVFVGTEGMGNVTPAATTKSRSRLKTTRVCCTNRARLQMTAGAISRRIRTGKVRIEVRKTREHLKAIGANYLLNVGTDGLGRIPDKAIEILRASC